MPSDTTALYVIAYDNGEPYGKGYVVTDRDSGNIVPSDSLKAPEAHREVALPLHDAECLMKQMLAKFPETYQWKLVRALAPCPQCGRDVWTNDLDVCYPNNREMTSWRVGCNEHGGGCGLEVHGPTREAAVLAWNEAPATQQALARMAKEGTAQRRTKS